MAFLSQFSKPRTSLGTKGRVKEFFEDNGLRVEGELLEISGNCFCIGDKC